MGLKIRVKEKAGWKNITADVVEICAGDMMKAADGVAENDDQALMWSTIAMSVYSSSKKIFKDADDVKQRLSARSFSEVVSLVNKTNGLDEIEEAKKN